MAEKKDQRKRMVVRQSEKTKIQLWVKAGGRCEYRGCNKPLWKDTLTQTEMNAAYIAHIRAVRRKGPRWHPELSEKYKQHISNLMLLCDEHHRLIDKEDVEGHPVSLLKEMKREHEKRIKNLTETKEDMKSHVIRFTAPIDDYFPRIEFSEARLAMLPHYPAKNIPIKLDRERSEFRDHEEEYWKSERNNLRARFKRLIKHPILEEENEIHHFSVFAWAPQPLLIDLGVLLSDITTVDVYQRHRETQNWKWLTQTEEAQYIIEGPNTNRTVVALNLSLSAKIDNKEIKEKLGEDTSIWRMTIDPRPNYYFVKSREQLFRFTMEFSMLLDRIKEKHGNTVLHIFPTVPLSIAIEIGRVWNRKSDLRLTVYDKNLNKTGFIKALDFPYEKK